MPDYTVTYCTVAEMRIVINPESKGITTTALSDINVAEHINTAEDIINAMLSPRYTVPFVAGSIPPLIKRMCIYLAAYYVLRSLYTRDSINKNDWVDDYFDRVMDEKTGLLIKVADGLINLVTTAGAVIATKISTVESSTEDYVPTANVDDPEAWAIDDNRLENIADERDAI